MELRRCNTCKEYKDPETGFYKSRKYKCKECVRQENMARYYADPEKNKRLHDRWIEKEGNRAKHNEYSRKSYRRQHPKSAPASSSPVKWCSECGHYKNRETEFGKRKAYCRECDRKVAKRRYWEKHDEVVAYNRQWRESHRERVNERGRKYYRKSQERKRAQQESGSTGGDKAE